MSYSSVNDSKRYPRDNNDKAYRKRSVYYRVLHAGFFIIYDWITDGALNSWEIDSGLRQSFWSKHIQEMEYYKCFVLQLYSDQHCMKV